MQPLATPERGRGVRNFFIAALISAAVTGGIYLTTRPESDPGPAPPPPAAVPVVPGHRGPPPPPPGSEAAQRVGVLRQILRQLQAQLAELRGRLETEEDPVVRQGLRAQIRALRQGIRQLEQQIAAS